jgi:hypothetical protein
MPDESLPMPEEGIALVDRGAFVVRPTWKFAEWVRSLEDPPEDDSLIFRHSVYLVEGTDLFDAESTVSWLETFHLDIAAHEFDLWWTAEDDWPPIRGLSDFFQYFECVPTETVVDLSADLPVYDRNEGDLAEGVDEDEEGEDDADWWKGADGK